MKGQDDEGQFWDDFMDVVEGDPAASPTRPTIGTPASRASTRCRGSVRPGTIGAPGRIWRSA